LSPRDIRKRQITLAHAATEIQQLPAAGIHKHAMEDAHGD
jgi:hypothetical protein